MVTELARRCRADGGRALIVGGCVRDALRGEPVADWDVEVYGLAEDRLVGVLKTFGRVNAVGKSFGVYKLGGSQEIDVSIPRRDSKQGPGHRGIHVEGDPTMSPTEAARRRDLTINAIMVDPLTGEFLDPWGGRADLERGLLRAVDRHTFLEDPLRALRVVQFAARFRFAVDADLVALAGAAALEELPAERILGEWSKLLLKGRAPSAGLAFARESGLLSRLFPWLPDDPATDVALDRAVAARDAADPEGRRLALMLTVWLWGHGPAVTTPVLDRLGVFRHKGYPAREKVLAALAQIGAPLHDDAAIRWLSTEAEAGLFLHAAHARGLDVADALTRAHRLGVMTDPPPPLLQGRDLKGLPIPPGPAMGQLLRDVYAAQLDGRLASTEAALTYARERLTPR